MRNTIIKAMTLALIAAGTAQAKTITIGPRLPVGTALTTSCTFEDPDCAFVQWSLPKGPMARIPARGTLTLWRVESLKGTARLLIVRRHDGASRIVARSAPVSEPCVLNILSRICGPAFGRVATFPVHMPVIGGDYIGLELISAANCPLSLDQRGCAEVGTFDGFGTPLVRAFNDYFDPPPPPGVPARPTGVNQPGEILFNAQVQLQSRHKRGHRRPPHRRHHRG